VICPADEVLIYLGLATTNPLVVLLQPMVEKLVRNFVGYHIEFKEYIEYLPSVPAAAAYTPLIDQWERYSGGQQSLLQLKNLPVRSILSVHENSSAWNVPTGTWGSNFLLSAGAYLLDLDEDGWCRTGHLLRQGGSWSLAPRSVRVEYEAGYTALELQEDYPEFRAAVLLGMAKAYNEALAYQQGDGAGVGPIQAERIDTWSANYATASRVLELQYDLPQGAKRILEPFVRPSL
jgi:hypothetical protein